MDKIKHIIKGLYGISESKKMIPAESARFTLNKTVECLEIALSEHDSNLLDKVAETIKNGCTCTDYFCGAPFNKDCANCSNYMIDYPSVIEVINELKAEVEK